jgi:peptidyl-prolyl cis-trans isomerase C
MRSRAKGRRSGAGAAAFAVLVATAAVGAVLGQDPGPAAPPKKPAATKPSTAAPGGAARPSSSDVVARVNDSPILRRDFDLAVQLEFRRRGPGERHHEDLKVVRDGVLDALIDRELLRQRAAKSGVRVDETQVTQEVAKLKGMLGTEQEAAEFMHGAGLTDKDLAEEVRRTLQVRRFVDTEIAGDLTVTDAEAHAWYDAHPEAVTRPEAVRISQIVVRVAPDATAADRATAREKIEAILKELRGGLDFGEAARLYSDGPEAARKGDSGWVWAGGGALPSVERAALALQPGGVSDIVESRRGFHIIKVTDHRPAGPVPFDEAHDRIVARIKDDRRDARLHDYVATLRKDARIEKLI